MSDVRTPKVAELESQVYRFADLTGTVTANCQLQKFLIGWNMCM